MFPPRRSFLRLLRREAEPPKRIIPLDSAAIIAILRRSPGAYPTMKSVVPRAGEDGEGPEELGEGLVGGGDLLVIRRRMASAYALRYPAPLF